MEGCIHPGCTGAEGTDLRILLVSTDFSTEIQIPGLFPIQVFLYIFSTFKVSIYLRLVTLLKSHDKMSNKTYMNSHMNSLYEYRLIMSLSRMQREEVKNFIKSFKLLDIQREILYKANFFH